MNKNHKMKDYADTTLEPLPKKKKNYHKMAALMDRGECEMETNIHSLNDDCLREIFAMLNFKDRINFADACDRFSDLFKMQYCSPKNIFKDLDLNDLVMDDSISLVEAQRFLKIMGKYIETIRCIQFNILPETNTPPINLLEFVANFCTNLIAIGLHGVRLNAPLLTKLFMNIKNVKKLSLVRCHLDDYCLLPIAENLQNLESLDISHNKSLVGEHLSKFHKIKQLNIRECLSITSKNFINLCQAQSQLTNLDIQVCDKLNQRAFNEMAFRMTNLKCLKMSNKISKFRQLVRIEHLENLEIQGPLTEIDFSNICQLRNLKILNCSRNSKITDIALMKLTKLKLIELHIMFCRRFTYEGLLNYLQENPKLNLLNIRWCTHLNNEFVLLAIDVLRKQADRTEPCKFVIGHTRITEDVLMNNENESLISIDF